MSSIEYLYSLFNLERGRVIEEEEVEETGDVIFIVCCNGDYNMVKKSAQEIVARFIWSHLSSSSRRSRSSSHGGGFK
jgi:hypothetical protein